jgi:type II secretory ATPase GspE/PulE/Tfp pilus assembly ATPase PilB-like protein
MMVGEIRDRETLDMAMESAMTGHLVFSTVHTNSSAETITRVYNL